MFPNFPNVRILKTFFETFYNHDKFRRDKFFFLSIRFSIGILTGIKELSDIVIFLVITTVM